MHREPMNVKKACWLSHTADPELEALYIETHHPNLFGMDYLITQIPLYILITPLRFVMCGVEVQKYSSAQMTNSSSSEIP